MEKEERVHNYFFTGLLVGGFLGGLTGLLSAPKSGKELRRDIRDTGENTLKETKEIFEKASQKISEVPERAKHIFSCIKQKGESMPRYSESEREFVTEG